MVENEIPRNIFNATEDLEFQLDFWIQDKDNIVVTKDGDLVSNLDYYVDEETVMDNNGGKVIFYEPITGVIVIERKTPLERTTDYNNSLGNIKATPLNEDFDRLWRSGQELALGLDTQVIKQQVDMEDIKEYIDSLAFDSGITTDDNIRVTVTNGVLRNQHLKNEENKSPADYGAVGDGVVDDTVAITTYMNNSGSGGLNLYGKIYKVSAIPTVTIGQYFTNGRFLLPDAQIIQADENLGMIAAESSTGGIGSPFSGGLGIPRVYVASGGTGSGASYTANIFDGSVVSVNRLNTGNNYSDVPVVKFVGGGGTGAFGEAVLTGSQITSIDILDGGTGYTSAPTVQFVISGGSGAKAIASVDNNTKTVDKVTVNSGGNGYPDTPILTVTGNGAGASIVAVVTGGVISSVAIISGGTGYTSASIAITHNGGSGATFGTITISSGVITGVAVTNGGSGYNAGAEIILGNQLRGSGATVQGAFNGGVLTKIAVTNGGGGYYVTPTISGRTNRFRRIMVGSQGSAATFDKAGVYSSIYCHSNGNVSANLAARHSVAGCPQSVNIAAEECEVYGFQGGNFVSQFSQAEGSSTFNLGADRCATSAAHGGNIASIRCTVGRGTGFRGVVNLSGGVITSITIVDGGTGYSTSDKMSASDRLVSPTTPAEFTYTVDGNGKITSVTVVYGGIGYSAVVSIRVDPRGDYAAVLASGYSKTTNQYSVVVGSRGSVVNGLRSGTYSSENCTIESELAATLASTACSLGVNNYRSLALASNSVAMTGSLGGTVAIAALNCDMVSNYSVVLGRRVRVNTDDSLSMGYGTSGSALSANTKIRMGFSSGNISAAGTITGSVVFTDYAEIMPNLVKGVIGAGTLVSLGSDGINHDKVKIADVGDVVIGVISKTALIVAGDTPHEWSGRHMLGEFGEPLFKDIEDPDHPHYVPDVNAVAPYVLNPGAQKLIEYPVYEGDVIVGSEKRLDPDYIKYIKDPSWEAPLVLNPIPARIIKVPVENPLFDPEQINVPRSQRPEDYSIVGFLGQVYVKIGKDVKSGDSLVSGANGVAIKSKKVTNLTCMRIKQPYDVSKGYGVGFCLLK